MLRCTKIIQTGPVYDECCDIDKQLHDKGHLEPHDKILYTETQEENKRFYRNRCAGSPLRIKTRTDGQGDARRLKLSTFFPPAAFDPYGEEWPFFGSKRAHNLA